MQDRIVARFCAWVTWLVFAGLAAATIAYEYHLLTTSTIPSPYPMTIYEQMPTPGTKHGPNMRGVAGADFSQVYTSALALRHGESAYRASSPQFADRFGRPPGYPPLMNWVAVPLSYLDYEDALLMYTALALIALLGTSALLLRRVGLSEHIGKVTLLQASLYFLTPIGLTHLERGQFDGLVATAGVLTVGCVYAFEAPFAFALVAGFLGALKWTSVAFLGGFSLLGFLLSTGKKRWCFFLIPVVMLAGTLSFFRDLVDYWTTIRVYEIDAAPFGLTMQHYLPRAVARAMPVALTVLVVLTAFARSRSAADRAFALRQISAPFAIALMNLAVCFGTLSYEYHTVATLGMIPVLVVWTCRVQGVRVWLKAATCTVFGSFLVVVFRTYGFGWVTFEQMTGVYMGVALLLFLLCLLLLVVRPRPIAL